MLHDCSALWRAPPLGGGQPVNQVVLLEQLVEAEDAAQQAAGYLLGGWAYWIPQKVDFDKVRDAFEEICLALDTSVIPGGHWVGALGAAPPFQPLVDDVPPIPVDPNRAAQMGDAAMKVVAGLDADGQIRDHHVFYGVHGWMNDGQPFPNPYNQAIALRESLRNALDR